VLIEAGKPGDAVGALHEAIAIFRETGDHHAEGNALHNLECARAALRA
jgi:hypothetical protein